MNPNEYSQELPCYPFAVKLDKCVGSCNTLNGLSYKVCVPNKTEDLNLTVFSIMKGINESKKLTKHISCESKCRFDRRKSNLNQLWNNGKCHVYEKDYTWNPATCSCSNGKYLASIMDDSVITCDEVIESYNEETKTVPTNLIKNATGKTKNFYNLLAFLLITIALLIAVSI